MKKILIIIPIHNEARNLLPLIPQVQREAKKMHADVIAINDASNDHSLQVLEQFQVKTLSHSIQMGYGTTVQTGYKYAYRYGYDYVIQLDGDGQHDPRSAPTILQELRCGKIDIVIGSRFLPKKNLPYQPARELYTCGPVRRVGITLFRVALICLCFRNISDPTSGYIGFNRRAIRFVCGNSFPHDYPDADMILTLVRNGFRLREIPVCMYKNEGRSKLHRGCKPVWYVIKVSLSLLVASLRPKEAHYDDCS